MLARPPRPGVHYVAFADPSGGVGDAFTCAVATDAAVAQIANVLKSYRCRSVTGDRYSQEWVVQAFGRHGIRYEHSEHDRSALYGNMLPLLTSARARLLDSKRLIQQLAGLERTVLPAGRERIDHVRGGHDDLSNSTAGAFVLASGKPLKLNITPEVLRWAVIPAVPAARFAPRNAHSFF